MGLTNSTSFQMSVFANKDSGKSLSIDFSSLSMQCPFQSSLCGQALCGCFFFFFKAVWISTCAAANKTPTSNNSWPSPEALAL